MENIKYKEGDHVRIKNLDWYNENKNKYGEIWTVCLSGKGTICFDKDNAKYCGKEVTIFSIESEYYVLRGIPFEWTDEMIEGLVEEEVGLVDNFSSRWVNEFNLPDGYIFKDENGNIINATKIVLEKKKKEYPKTYEECCFVLHEYPTQPNVTGYKHELLHTFRKLLICRDAYWKIAGEEMRLGKPWEPDWEDENQEKHIISSWLGTIQGLEENFVSLPLAFPTEEMRDAFYENFKELIEQCKELL